ncbi:Methionyl-tRNA formyltransferase, mitochondrial [Trachymyrmex cornetzi]|uniref:methionyl-tRNA formyltransferase n=1 Tax=Trachymyrmex cornetzi TaxID=471704 RepID=A0A151J865_9HYME|nr:Methionyl-tRNA formyltransferase, mitochondrial [Trachymyrmex cornetzi]
MLNVTFLTRVIKIHLHLHATFTRNNKSRELTFSYCAYHIRKRQSHSSPTGGPWNVLFFGTSNFSLESLRSLYNEYRAKKLCRLEVVSVCKEKKNVVIQYAEEKGIIVNEWPLENNPQDFHIGIVVAFGHLIPLNIINSFPLGILNVHNSLLPRWRGAAPDIYTLMKGDTQTGITIMRVAKKFDTGDIVTQEKIDIHADETRPELNMKLAKLGANVLIDVIGKLPQVLSSSRPQGKLGVTYAPKVSSKTSLVKWDEMTAKNVYDLQRALLGLYPLKTKFDDVTIKLLDVRQTSKPDDGRNVDIPEFFDVVGVFDVMAACTSCGGVGVELASSLQCLNLRGADVSTRSTSDPEDSLSHSEHCLQIATLKSLMKQLEWSGNPTPIFKAAAVGTPKPVPVESSSFKLYNLPSVGAILGFTRSVIDGRGFTKPALLST